MPVADVPLQSKGIGHHLISTGRTLLINRDAAAESVRGGIDLVDYGRADAFADPDVRLLETLAASMSVALENARLFGETQRLLKETERRSAAAEKHLDIAYLFEGEVPPAIRGDVMRLRQVLLNLLSNSVKFTDNGNGRGEVVLTVRVEGDEQTEGGSRLHFTVRDTGIGLSRTGLSRLFQKFSQADSSTTRKYGGTGLGLAISKLLAELMGGSMWAESAGPGQGSRFHFTMSCKAAELPHGSRRDSIGEQAALKGRRILVVDDNATNRRILALQTAQWGMAVQDTEAPEQALVLFTSLGRKEAADSHFAATLACCWRAALPPPRWRRTWPSRASLWAAGGCRPA